MSLCAEGHSLSTEVNLQTWNCLLIKSGLWKSKMSDAMIWLQYTTMRERLEADMLIYSCLSELHFFCPLPIKPPDLSSYSLMASCQKKGSILKYFWSYFCWPNCTQLKSPRLWKLKLPWEWQTHGRQDATQETYLFSVSGPSVFTLLHKRLNRLPLLFALVFYSTEITKALSIIEK